MTTTLVLHNIYVHSEAGNEIIQNVDDVRGGGLKWNFLEGVKAEMMEKIGNSLLKSYEGKKKKMSHWVNEWVSGGVGKWGERMIYGDDRHLKSRD